MPRPRWTGRKWSAIAAGITSPAPGSPAARFTTPPAPIAPVPCPGAAAGPTAAGGRHHARRRSAPPDGHAAAPRSLPPRPDPGGGWARPAQQLRRLRPVQRAGQCRLEPLAAAELAAGQVGTRPVQPQQRQAQPLCVGRRSRIRVLQLRNDQAPGPAAPGADPDRRSAHAPGNARRRAAGARPAAAAMWTCRCRSGDQANPPDQAGRALVDMDVQIGKQRAAIGQRMRHAFQRQRRTVIRVSIACQHTCRSNRSSSG